ncbi:MAG: cation-transporting P-type ATPase, partial [Candidatus Nezhaarchaeales archaeon]
MNGYKGLTSSEVAERLRIYGPNRVPEKRERLVTVFLKKFTGFTPFAIEAAAVVSYVMGRYVDFIIMLSLLLVNTVIGVIHEHRAGRAIEMLKSKLKVTVKAFRDGRWIDVAAEDIVPDDIVKLSMGDI